MLPIIRRKKMKLWCLDPRRSACWITERQPELALKTSHRHPARNRVHLNSGQGPRRLAGTDKGEKKSIIRGKATIFSSGNSTAPKFFVSWPLLPFLHLRPSFWRDFSPLGHATLS